MYHKNEKKKNEKLYDKTRDERRDKCIFFYKKQRQCFVNTKNNNKYDYC